MNYLYVKAESVSTRCSIFATYTWLDTQEHNLSPQIHVFFGLSPLLLRLVQIW